MPLSLNLRTHRIIDRLKALEQFMDWSEEHGNTAPRAGFWTGLSELLHDVRRDVRFLSRAPFPLSEWQGETWEDFLDEYDQTYNESDLSDTRPDES